LLTYDNVEIDDDKPAKHGGIDIEGIAFAPADEGIKHHTLGLGMRGPLTKTGKAIMLPVCIPVRGIFHPDTWRIGEAVFHDLRGNGIRDLEFNPSKRKILILAGPMTQDKGVHPPQPYELCVWDPYKGGQAVQVGQVKKLPNEYIIHDQIKLPERVKKLLQRQKIPNKEKTHSFASPEGICQLGEDTLLVVWDHNDAGLFAALPYPSL